MELTLDALAFERNHFPLFSEIHRNVHAGELLQITGANGSGKSTLLRIIAGFIEPHSGVVLWQGNSIFKMREEYQAVTQYLGHLNGIKLQLTALENLRLSAALMGIQVNDNAIRHALDKVNFPHANDTHASQFSAGQMRRLALARLLLKPAAVWILDEPMTALDVDGQSLVKSLLQNHLQNGGLAVVATHHDLLLADVNKSILNLSFSKQKELTLGESSC